MRFELVPIWQRAAFKKKKAAVADIQLILSVQNPKSKQMFSSKMRSSHSSFPFLLCFRPADILNIPNTSPNYAPLAFSDSLHTFSHARMHQGKRRRMYFEKRRRKLKAHRGQFCLRFFCTGRHNNQFYQNEIARAAVKTMHSASIHSISYLLSFLPLSTAFWRHISTIINVQKIREREREREKCGLP